MCNYAINGDALSLITKTMHFHVKDSSGDVSSNHINFFHSHFKGAQAAPTIYKNKAFELTGAHAAHVIFCNKPHILNGKHFTTSNYSVVGFQRVVKLIQILTSEGELLSQLPHWLLHYLWMEKKLLHKASSLN
jgi:hypothetical protein